MIQAASPVAPRRVLLVKTSSMGDLVHTLSALEEARQHCPQLVVDWVCEESFKDIPLLSAAVDQVIPVAIRRWRKQWWSAKTRAEVRHFLSLLRKTHYDLVIDAQGLIKSAWITRAARCTGQQRWGFDWSTIREPLASLVLDHKVHAPAHWHAIDRLRALFGAALGYAPTGSVAVLAQPQAAAAPTEKTIFFLHGTSRPEKAWPLDSWVALGRQLASDGYRIQLPWGSEQERHQAEQIANTIGDAAQVLPQMSTGQLAQALCKTYGSFGVDSGLMHLSVALGRPTVAIMSAAHLPKFSAARFAPFWAQHAHVVERASGDQPFGPKEVLLAWHELVKR